MSKKRVDFVSLAFFYLNLPQTDFTVKDLNQIPTLCSKSEMLKLLVDMNVVEAIDTKYRKKPLTTRRLARKLAKLAKKENPLGVFE